MQQVPAAPGASTTRETAGHATGSVQFVIVTGLSGAGKTEAVRAFEDMGYFCVDNLPPALIPTFAELCRQSGHIRRAALVSDARGGEFFDQLFAALAELERNGIPYRILFLEASEEVLVRRYKATRRRHPLSPEGGILDGIRAERHLLEPLRGRADIIIDTTSLSPRQLREHIRRQLGPDGIARGLAITVVSFGYSRGIPLDADLIFDVRFLPNPHYVFQLRALTGNNPEVAEYVFRWPVSQQFMQRLTEFVDFLIPHFVNEGKSHLIIGVGCTGGRHRSVAVANRLVQHLHEEGLQATVEHRDVDQPPSEARDGGTATGAVTWVG